MSQANIQKKRPLLQAVLQSRAREKTNDKKDDDNPPDRPKYPAKGIRHNTAESRRKQPDQNKNPAHTLCPFLTLLVKLKFKCFVFAMCFLLTH